jgi:hypothetical protein
MMVDEAQQSLRALLASANPYGSPVMPDVESRAIVAPVLDQLTESQWDALKSAFRGDPFLWYAVVGSEHTGMYWPACDLESVQQIRQYSDYQQVASCETHALWSPRSSGVVLVTEQWFGIAAGSTAFLSRLDESWPPWPGGPATLRENLTAFIRDERSAVEQPWFRELLAHVYGAATAANAIASVGSERGVSES